MRHEQLLAFLYEATEDTKAWTRFVELLGDTLGGSAVILSLPHPAPGLPGRVIAPALEERFVASYQRSYFSADPFWEVMRSGEVGSVFKGTLEALPADFRTSAFYKEWLEPQGLLPSRFLGALLANDSEAGAASIAIFSRRGARFAGSGVQQPLVRLMPHLCRAARIHFRNARLAADRQALGSALDRLPLGVLLVDEHGRIRSANHVADQLLRARDGVVLGRDGLRATRPEESATLLALIEHAARSRCAEPAGVLLQRPSGRRPLEAVVVPLAADESEPALAAVFLADPEQSLETPNELMRAFYDLTPCEAALAQEIASGHRLEEAAEHLRVTPGTARQRLGQIFAKTNTRRQASLVRLLLRGAGNLHWQGQASAECDETPSARSI
jgi:DNA-binding CsgD family transcriptional regulator/PAS domain-containing protein